MADGSRWVDGGVAIDGAVMDAGFLGELEDDIGVFAATVGNLNRLLRVVVGFQQSNGMVDFLLQFGSYFPLSVCCFPRVIWGHLIFEAVAVVDFIFLDLFFHFAFVFGG